MRLLRLQIGLLVVPADAGKFRVCWPLILTSLIIVAGGAWLTVSPLAGALGFVPLPPLYWLFLALMLIGYPTTTIIASEFLISTENDLTHS